MGSECLAQSAGRLPGMRPLVDGGLDDTCLAGSKFGFGKEAGAPFLHRQEWPAIDGGFKVEAKEMGVVLAEEFFDSDVVDDGLAGRAERAVEGDHGI